MDTKMSGNSLFSVFLCKNLLYLRFNWVMLTVIFLGCYGIQLTYLKSTYNLINNVGKVYESKTYLTLKQDYFPANEYDLLFYGPSTDAADTLMELVRNELEITQERFKGFDDVDEMRLILENKCIGTCFAISFYQIPEPGGIPGPLKYNLSSNALRLSPKKRYVNDEEVNGNKDDDDYIRSGYVTVQHAVDREYNKWIASTIEYELVLFSMPTINRTHMDSQRVLHFGTIFTILFNVLLLGTFLVPLVEEKQFGIKEFLTLATPRSALNGLTFFIIRFALYLIFLLFVLLTAYFYQALGTVQFSLIIILFVLYVLAAMSYAYLISVCFNSVFYAKVGGLLLLVIPYIFYLVKSGLSNVAFYLFSTKTFMEGLDVFQTFTNKHRTFTSADLFTIIKAESFCISTVYMVLIAQIGFYTLIYNYLACVFPGPGGLKRPYLFFLSPSFYKKRQRNEYTTQARGTDAIIIENLVKKFKTAEREIFISNNLNMTIKTKQITVLLGHNGAGKTTTLNMIMGLVPKDSGKIVVCSERDVASYRHLIGFCPQHSVFMNYMTCKQHLVFFAKLRGLNSQQSIMLADELLRQLGLFDKSDEYGKHLSGGMKRRLSLGIALSGETKIVVLDEPSSGLDIESRRELWDILLQLRKTKTVLVTTHYMEEAEVLGDTICILANGVLQRHGSPLELKRKYGSGYRLKLCSNGIDYKEQETMHLIQQIMPTAKVLNVVPPTVYISLPYIYRPYFLDMLHRLEQAKEHLGIDSISITDTSLEDVFLNCAAELGDHVDSPDCSRVEDPAHFPYERLSDNIADISCIRQFRAILYKKRTFLQNEWIYTVIMLLLPIICAIGTILQMHSMSVVTNESVLPINPEMLKKGTILLYNPTEQNSNIEKLFKHEIESYRGMKLTKLNLTGNNTVVDEILQMQKDNLADFLQNVVGVIDMSQNTKDGIVIVQAYVSGNIYHSSILLTNIVDTVLLKSFNTHYSIETTYAPLRKFVTDVSPTRLEYYAIVVSIGMFFSMFYYLSLPFREHASGFKELQPMPRSTYWLCTFLCDVLLLFAMCFVLYHVQKLVMTNELYNEDEQFAIVSSIFFYGCSYLPILYSLATIFKSISTISTYLLCMLIVSAIVPLITSSNLQAIQFHETKIVFLSLMPDFNLNHQLRLINENFIINRRNMLTYEMKARGVERVSADINLGQFYVEAILVTFLGLVFLICVLEDKYRRQSIVNFLRCRSCLSSKMRRTSDGAGTGVSNEENQCDEEKRLVEDIILQKSEINYPLIVNKLYKQYHPKRRPAVNDLSFAVKKGQCFGLLGVNGAGKTSAFQMITANTTISDGNIIIDGIDIRASEAQYKYRFGYCPQHDALNDFMTAGQSINYMGMLRGLNNKDLSNELLYWVEKMDLCKYRNVQIRHYSGGTKRKLQAALAMIGNPSLVLLDEPTTGVDPVSRRFLWKCIQDFQKQDKTVVLTSHSMDECEQLCNRLAIMADGKFQCIGGICDLKLRYGSGFTIKVKIKHQDGENLNDIEYITEEMRGQFSASELREHHAGILTYFVRNDNRIDWSNVFKRMEQFLYDVNHRNGNLIEDYSVNESTLEDIFLKFDTKNRRKSSAPLQSV